MAIGKKVWAIIPGTLRIASVTKAGEPDMTTKLTPFEHTEIIHLHEESTYPTISKAMHARSTQWLKTHYTRHKSNYKWADGTPVMEGDFYCIALPDSDIDQYGFVTFWETTMVVYVLDFDKASNEVSHVYGCAPENKELGDVMNKNWKQLGMHVGPTPVLGDMQVVGNVYDDILPRPVDETVKWSLHIGMLE